MSMKLPANSRAQCNVTAHASFCIHGDDHLMRTRSQAAALPQEILAGFTCVPPFPQSRPIAREHPLCPMRILCLHPQLLSQHGSLCVPCEMNRNSRSKMTFLIPFCPIDYDGQGLSVCGRPRATVWL